MESAAFPESAGQQFAEAILAAALSLPLVFAVGELRNSRLLREPAPTRAAESSPVLRSSRPPKLAVASPPPILAHRDGHAMTAAARSGAEATNRKTQNTQESVTGADPAPGNGGMADAAELDEAAARRSASVMGVRLRKGSQTK